MDFLKRAGLAAAVSAFAALAGCGGGAPPPPAAVTPAAPVAPAAVVRPKEPDSSKALPPIAYEPKGRRDPFTPIFPVDVLMKSAPAAIASSEARRTLS